MKPSCLHLGSENILKDNSHILWTYAVAFSLNEGRDILLTAFYLLLLCLYSNTNYHL